MKADKRLNSPDLIGYTPYNRKKKGSYYPMMKHKPSKKNDDGSISLGDLLNQDILSQLQDKKSKLKEEEQRRMEEIEKQKREERKRREKNKSFEELLNESNLNWKQFKG